MGAGHARNDDRWSSPMPAVDMLARFTGLIRFLIPAIILSGPALSEAEQSKLIVRRIDPAANNPGAAVEDIRTAFSSGLPLAAEWNIGQTGRG